MKTEYFAWKALNGQKFCSARHSHLLRLLFVKSFRCIYVYLYLANILTCMYKHKKYLITMFKYFKVKWKSLNILKLDNMILVAIWLMRRSPNPKEIVPGYWQSSIDCIWWDGYIYVFEYEYEYVHVLFWVWLQDFSKYRWRSESWTLRSTHRCKPHGSSAEHDLHCQTLTMSALCPALFRKEGAAGKDPKARIQKLWLFFNLYQDRNDKFGMNSPDFWTTIYREKNPTTSAVSDFS